jgi:transcriptional regulator with XRE-family HTH domain
VRRLSPFGELLRAWRESRGLSQLALAREASVSPRHLSFVETGRAEPSREMVLTLATALDVPLRERNALLRLAGHVDVFAETPLDAPEMIEVKRALDHVLDANVRFPTLVVTASYHLVRANRAAQRFFAHLAVPALGAPRPNLLRALLASPELRASLENWNDVASAMLVRTRRESLAGPARRELSQLVAELDARGEALEVRAPDLTRPLPLLLPLRFRIGARAVSLFSTLTTLGTPLDVTLQELRIETMFPADAASAAQLDQLIA